MLKKCDFCKYFSPVENKCLKASLLLIHGSTYCECATKAFERYVHTLARTRSTHTKNVNINKKVYRKKR